MGKSTVQFSTFAGLMYGYSRALDEKYDLFVCPEGKEFAKKNPVVAGTIQSFAYSVVGGTVGILLDLTNQTPLPYLFIGYCLYANQKSKPHESNYGFMK